MAPGGGTASVGDAQGCRGRDGRRTGELAFEVVEDFDDATHRDLDAELARDLAALSADDFAGRWRPPVPAQPPA